MAMVKVRNKNGDVVEREKGKLQPGDVVVKKKKREMRIGRAELMTAARGLVPALGGAAMTGVADLIIARTPLATLTADELGRTAIRAATSMALTAGALALAVKLKVMSASAALAAALPALIGAAMTAAAPYISSMVVDAVRSGLDRVLPSPTGMRAGRLPTGMRAGPLPSGLQLPAGLISQPSSPLGQPMTVETSRRGGRRRSRV